MPDFLNELLERNDVKFVFVGGKGGVGKTTTSSAIAIQFSYDRKVLLLSTDPAHSLSDAFRVEFKGTPTVVPGIPNLSVMEVNPETSLAGEIAQWAKLAADSGFDEMVTNVKEFQEWLSGVPGIDEATALSNVIGYVESGEYDTIVFDTAPTGHTLKLLQLPQILQLGLDKLNSWQSKLWGYWTALKGLGTSKQQMATIQTQVAQRLASYKAGIEKIGVMLKDRVRTNFVVVCIAEHLSVNESRRLLRELKRHQVEVSHVVVNQLVVNNLDPKEMADLEGVLARASPTEQEESSLLRRMRASIQLCNARRAIQRNYLGQLKAGPEVAGDGKAPALRCVEMPLLSSEVTGAEALLAFSLLLVPEGYRDAFADGPAQLQGWVPHPISMRGGDSTAGDSKAAAADGADQDRSSSSSVKRARLDPNGADPEPAWDVGATVVISGLSAAHYNGRKARVVQGLQANGRVGIQVTIDGKVKQIAVRPANLTLVPAAAAAASPTASAETASPGGGMFDSILANPEVQEKLKIPKFARALADVQKNPANFLQYMMDPEIGPFVQKMMGSMGGGGGGF